MNAYIHPDIKSKSKNEGWEYRSPSPLAKTVVKELFKPIHKRGSIVCPVTDLPIKYPEKSDTVIAAGYVYKLCSDYFVHVWEQRTNKYVGYFISEKRIRVCKSKNFQK